MGTDEDHAQMVEVPATENLLSASDYSELCTLLDPTVSTDSHGLDQYRLTLQFVADKILSY